MPWRRGLEVIYIIWNGIWIFKIEFVVFFSFILAILGSDFEPNFSIQHQQKDMRLAIDMGDLYDQSFPVAAAANEVRYQCDTYE